MLRYCDDETSKNTWKEEHKMWIASLKEISVPLPQEIKFTANNYWFHHYCYIISTCISPWLHVWHDYEFEPMGKYFLLIYFPWHSYETSPKQILLSLWAARSLMDVYFLCEEIMWKFSDNYAQNFSNFQCYWVLIMV